jgi:uncharacterized membrane protein (UPF0127 family)
MRVRTGWPSCLAGPLALALALAIPACGDRSRVPAPADLVPLSLAGTTIRVRVARTAAERREGLAGVDHLEADEGMLFVHPEPGLRRYVMRDCRMPLDVAFLDGDGRVLAVHTLPAPGPGETPAGVTSKDRCALVLEMPGGFFQAHGLGVGERLEVPETVREGR